MASGSFKPPNYGCYAHNDYPLYYKTLIKKAFIVDQTMARHLLMVSQ